MKLTTIQEYINAYFSPYINIFQEFLNPRKDKKIDVLFINHEESRTGAPKLVYEIAKYISLKYSILMVSKSKGSMHDVFKRAFHKILYPDEMFPKLNIHEKAKKILLMTKPGLVYVNSVASYEYALEAKKLGIPVILHIHEFERLFYEYIPKKAALKYFKDSADIFIAVSESVYGFLTKRLRCDRSNTFLIHGFINPKEVLLESKKKSLSTINKEIKKRKDEIIVAALGTCCLNKGTSIFIDSYHLLKKRGFTRLKYIWIGDNINHIQLFVDKMKNLDRNILFLGEKENPFPYLNAADIFLLLSKEDAFPLSAIEAMSLGKPIISFKRSGENYRALEGCGMLINKRGPSALANAVIKLSNNIKLRRIYSEHCRLTKHKYDSKIILPRIKRIVDKLYNTSNKGT